MESAIAGMLISFCRNSYIDKTLYMKLRGSALGVDLEESLLSNIVSLGRLYALHPGWGCGKRRIAMLLLREGVVGTIVVYDSTRIEMQAVVEERSS